MKSLDKQVDGKHYKTMGIQPWIIIEENGLDFWEGNALKYLLRKKSDRISDLKKAIHYLEYLIERESKNESMRKTGNEHLPSSKEYK